MQINILCVGSRDEFENYIPKSTNGVTFVPSYEEDVTNEEKLIEAGQDADVIYISPMGNLSGHVMDNLPKLKLVMTTGVGFQWIDLEGAKRNNVYVCNCRGVNAIAVAEHAVMLMMALLRDAFNSDRSVRKGLQDELKDRVLGDHSLKEMGDCTIGLIGFGAIGKYVAQIARACNARVIYNDVFRASAEDEDKYCVAYVTREELLRQADIVSLHVPLMPSTENMVNKEFLAAMKQGSYVINTARGEVVNTLDLLEAIKSGHIAGAGLDTVAGEPISLDNPILQAEPEVQNKIILTGHTAGITGATIERIKKVLERNTFAIAEGKKPDFVVNGL